MALPVLEIDFVSDVSCPWCVIGLQALEQAAQRLAAELRLEWHFQPFELNPGMGPEGQNLFEHLQQKYGASIPELRKTHESIAARGAVLGFVFSPQRERIYNTFDAHRLLHWAGHEGVPGAQKALKQALFKAYFTDGLNPGDPAVLERLASGAGLDAAHAREVLASGAYAAEVREREAFYQGQGIHSVPAVIVNGRHLIQGGQPVEVFEQALRKIATEV